MHPDDERYAGLIGQTRHGTRSTGASSRSSRDEAVDPAFGTGAVKVTPAHDPTDFEIGAAAGAEPLNILNADATRSTTTRPSEFRGLDPVRGPHGRPRRARAEAGLLVKEERPYLHSVGHCYRCHTEIEPWLSGKQWFVKVGPLKEPAKQVALDGRLQFFPERWQKPVRRVARRTARLEHQPAAVVGPPHPRLVLRQRPRGRGARGSRGRVPSAGARRSSRIPDVLDTWFSSQLWPFSTLGWPDETEDLAFFYPTSVLVTGYEILYLWVARMVMSGLDLTGDVPFRHTMIHGLIRDEQGRKMSKSLGNVIDPLDSVERYGADALRYALLRQGTGGQDIPLSMDAIEAGRNFANKIWNAARLVLGEARGRRAGRGRRGSRTLVGAVDPVAARAVPGRGRRGHRGVPVRRRRGRPAPVPVVRARRLGPGDVRSPG